MMVFGKPAIEYFRFQALLLGLTAGLGLLRLGLSLGGIPWPVGGAVSMSGLSVIAIVYLPIRLHMKRFGGYRHLLGLFVVQLGLAGLISAAGILLAAGTGVGNAFEPDPATSNYVVHALSHFPLAPILSPLFWLVACPILWILRRLWPGSAPGA